MLQTTHIVNYQLNVAFFSEFLLHFQYFVLILTACSYRF